MLHLRLIVPADATDKVVRLLETTVGTAHLAVLTGAARDPAGDVVMCDVAREAGDELIGALRDMGIDKSGSITVENMDLTLSAHADRAEKAAPGEGADAVLWAELTEATHEESTFSVTYVAFLAVATMLAACGVMLDNAILIVGAMAVGPEFGPLAGISTALVRRSPHLVWRALWTLIAGFAIAMVVTAGFAWLMDAFGLFTRSMVEGDRPNTAFIWKPDWMSFVVAFLAGIAGTLSLTSAKSGALIGVAISVTTVPAAANAAVAFSYSDYTQTIGSTQQLLANLGGIVLAGTLTLLVQKGLWALHRRSETAVRRPPV
ncbi:DUF389 domain-containing protein [Streptomyces sp. BE147]|uniref:DUF389 domain-containing protein n=1 Tax=unclassified Streptomyces TaxID=2593676 RepID=UPI002E779F3D|nr:DUF389 domain-containing protein [Streptomyces sp. BE147]MEE1735602.1 DUF389 domain-containing protein [Streptomyces sp. BE147]